MHEQLITPTTPTRISRPERQRRTQELLEKAASTTDAAERTAALDEVVTLNMEVARSIAGRYRNRGVETDDLEQVAYAALVRAARNYDPARSGNFLTYAVPSVRGEVKKYFRDHGWTVRPPRRIQELQAAIFRQRQEDAQNNGHEPDVQQLADELDAPVEDIRQAMGADGCFAPASLDLPVGDGLGTSLGDLLADYDVGFDAAEARVMLRSAMRCLSPRDRLIVRLRFFEGLTQKEIGARVDVTQMQVSRLISRILRDLRVQLTGGEALSA